MSEVTNCLLCLNSCCDYKCLYDTDGVYDMELYNITVKYFNTMFLTEATKNQLPVVCCKCWQCMSDFNNFQKLIIMTHEQLQLSKESLKLPPEADGNQRANRNESLYELEQIDEGAIKMEDSLQQVGEQQILVDDRNKSPFELGLMDERSFKMAITTEPPCISNIETMAGNYIEEDRPEILSGDENSQSTSLYDIDSDSEECEENTETVNLLSGEDSDSNSLSHQSMLSNPDQHSSTDDMVNSKNKFKTRYTRKGQRKQKSSQELDEIISKWKSEFECAICKAVLPNFQLLRTHTKWKHFQRKCQILCCQRRHVGPSIIAEHAIFHMDPQTFKCHLCSKSFTASDNLYRHQKRVHSAPQNKCGYCRKIFVRKDDRDEHEAKHMGIKQYVCLLCSKAFRHRSCIYTHNKKSHPNEWLNRKGKTNSLYKKINLDDVRNGQDIPE